MVASPALVASEVMYRIPQTPLIDCSSGITVELINVFAVAPGNETKTLTIGGAIVGNCEVGRDLIANIPMKITRRDKTIARTGLFKNALNIKSYFSFDLSMWTKRTEIMILCSVR